MEFQDLTIVTRDLEPVSPDSSTYFHVDLAIITFEKPRKYYPLKYLMRETFDSFKDVEIFAVSVNVARR